MARKANPAGWERGRLMLTVVLVSVTGLALLCGLGYGVYLTASSATDANPPASRSSGSGTPRSNVRDEIAAAPMLAVSEQDARPSVPAAEPGPSVLIPAAARVGRAQVPSGFPRTVEGAVGQLAAIEVAVLQGMSVAYATDVYRAWALPGGPGGADWPLATNVRTFLGAAQMTEEIDPSATVQVSPKAAQVKGVEGPDWAVVCVLVVVEVHIDVPASMAYGYCERMQWSTGQRRWMIAPGPSPVAAPSTWPGTEIAQRAGWATWVDAAARVGR